MSYGQWRIDEELAKEIGKEIIKSLYDAGNYNNDNNNFCDMKKII